MSMHKIADHLAAMGRGNDKMLMHVTPNEVAGLQRLAMAHGGSLTVNPHTGLPEAGFFDFIGGLLPTAVGILAAPATGGSSLYPVLAGAATGAAISAIKGDNPLLGGLMGGLGGYGGAGIGEALKSAGTVAQTAPTLNAANEAARASAAQTLSNLSNPLQAGSMAEALAQPGVMGAGSGVAPTGFAGVQGSIGTPAGAAEAASGLSTAPTMGQLDQLSSGLQNLGTEAGRNAFVQSLGGTGPEAELRALGKVGLPVLGAGLAAIEPPKPLGSGDVYDPYATLNLSRPTKLRLYASGGIASAYEVPDNINSTPAQNEQSGYAMGGFRTQEASAAPGATVNVINQLPSAPATPQAGYPTIPQYDQPEKKMADGGDVTSGPQYALNVNSGEQQMMGAPQGMPPSFEGGPFMEAIRRLQMQRGMQGDANMYATENPFAQMLGIYNRPQPAAQPALQYPGILNLPTIGAAKGGYLDGPGDGMSDSIPATIEGKQPARLADGEFVVPADVVSHLGNGSTKAGAQKLYQMMDKVRTARTGTKKQGKQINPHKFLPA